MPNKDAKTPNSVAGPFYVDNDCISCGQCCDMAPDYFKENPETGNMYVCKQPETEDGKKSCKEALENCPVNAIGDDG